jgi:hypothetical protein
MSAFRPMLVRGPGIAAVPQGSAANLHVKLGSTVPVAAAPTMLAGMRWTGLRFEPFDGADGVFDPAASIARLRDVCYHRALWLSATCTSPFLLCPSDLGTFAAVLPGAAQAQIEEVDRDGQVPGGVAARAVAAWEAQRGGDKDNLAAPLPLLLLSADRGWFTPPSSDAEALRVAAQLREDLRESEETPRHTTTPAPEGNARHVSGPCHPSFWSVFRELRGRYVSDGSQSADVFMDFMTSQDVAEVHGRSRPQPKEADAADAQEWEDVALEPGDPLYFACRTAKRIVARQDVAVHRGTDTLTAAAAVRVLLHASSVEGVRWIEPLLLEESQPPAPFPDIALARSRRKDGPPRVVVANKATGRRATDEALLAAFCRLSVLEPALWRSLVRRIESSQTSPNLTAEELADAPCSARDLRIAMKLHLGGTSA